MHCLPPRHHGVEDEAQWDDGVRCAGGPPCPVRGHPADFGHPPDAERILTSLEDGVRVASTVTEDGVIVYEFKEVIHRQRRLNASEPRP